MEELRVTIVQQELAWEKRENNLALFGECMGALEGKTDLVLLPEMFTTGFTMNAQTCGETMDGPTVRWLREKARELDAHVTGTLIIKEEDRFFNRLIWAEPGGAIHVYDKRHLFRMAGEDGVFTAGSGSITIRCRGWRVRPFICYDLRFPVWGRNRNNEYDLALYLANWPRRRASHWRILLQARAVENQAFVAGVNRVGDDEKGIDYAGDSCIIDPWGNDVVRLGDGAGCVTAVLSRRMLESSRRDFPVWRDADDYEFLPCKDGKGGA